MKKENSLDGRLNNGHFAEGNKFSPGRKPIYSNGEELASKLLEYFDWIKGEYEIHHKITTKTTGSGKESVTTTESEPVKIWTRNPEEPTITGLALFLGFESRQSLYDNAKKAGFSYPIKKSLLHIENNYEKGLWGDKVAGVIFALKNMGWADKIEFEEKEKPIAIDYSKLTDEQLQTLRELLEIAKKNE